MPQLDHLRRVSPVAMQMYDLSIQLPAKFIVDKCMHPGGAAAAYMPVACRIAWQRFHSSLSGLGRKHSESVHVMGPVTRCRCGCGASFWLSGGGCGTYCCWDAYTLRGPYHVCGTMIVLAAVVPGDGHDSAAACCTCWAPFGGRERSRHSTEQCPKS